MEDVGFTFDCGVLLIAAPLYDIQFLTKQKSQSDLKSCMAGKDRLAVSSWRRWKAVFGACLSPPSVDAVSAAALSE